MINVLSTCIVIIGKKSDFENAFKEVVAVHEKHGAKLVGFWWTLGSEGNEAVWIFSWKNLEAFEKGREAVWQDREFPTDKFASTAISYTEKILVPSPLYTTR